MITIILENSIKNTEIARLSLEGNESYLVCDDNYELLGSISEYDYDVFSPDDMLKLVDELESLKDGRRSDEVRHIDEIITLAKQCEGGDGLVLTFTPFA